MSDPTPDDSKLEQPQAPAGRSVFSIIMYVVGSLGFTLVGLVTFVFFTCRGCG